jgi:hypothetical protein
MKSGFEWKAVVLDPKDLAVNDVTQALAAEAEEEEEAALNDSVREADRTPLSSSAVNFGAASFTWDVPVLVTETAAAESLTFDCMS